MLSRTTYCTREDGILPLLSSLNLEEIYCTHAGKVLPNVVQFVKEHKDEDVFINIHVRLLGGKGGFGSLLRSFRVNKSTNQLMCRDLNGRRLASVDEERKLKKWIEKAAQREKEKQEKQKAKYERLKNGTAKHEFNDPEYIRKREDILDSTEDAFEQGFAHFKNKKKSKKVEESSSSDSDMDVEEFLVMRGTLKRKRKQTDSGVPTKKTKDENEEEDSDDDEEEPTEILEGLKQYFAVKNETEKPDINSETEKKPLEKEESKKNVKYIPREEQTFDTINLEDYNSLDDLEKLGLDWLRHALLARGLKCGGTLQERAKRLFSVRGLDPKDYPKNALAAKK